MGFWSIFGRTYRNKEIEENFNVKLLIQDRWPFYAKMTLCNTGWQWRLGRKRPRVKFKVSVVFRFRSCVRSVGAVAGLNSQHLVVFADFQGFLSCRGGLVVFLWWWLVTVLARWRLWACKYFCKALFYRLIKVQQTFCHPFFKKNQFWSSEKLRQTFCCPFLKSFNFGAAMQW